MTATIAPAGTPTGMTRSNIDMARVVRVGSLVGATMVYISVIGLLATFNRRLLIDPWLSLGYLVLFAAPILGGLQFTKRVKLEGLEPEPASASDLVQAAIAGAIGGLMAALFASIVNAFPDLRSTFPNWSPELVEILTLGFGVGRAFLVLPLISAVVATMAASSSFLPERTRKAVVAGVITVVGVSLFQPVVDDFFDWLPAIPDFLYTSSLALSVVAAVIVFFIGAAASYFKPERRNGLAKRLGSDDPAVRRRTTIATTIVIGIAMIALPQFLGGIINELLVNVGFFALMAIGLNVVIGYAGLLDLGYVAFFAVGAYTTGVLTSPLSPTWTPMLTWWQAFPIVIAMAALAGLFVGTPVLRMRGDYLAIVTLGFGEIVRILLLSDWLSPYFGGAQGLRNIPGIPIFGTNVNVNTPQLMVYMVMAFVLIAAFVSWRLEHSRIGRATARMD